VLCPWRGTDCRPTPLRRRGSRPQLKRDPLGCTRSCVRHCSVLHSHWRSPGQGAKPRAPFLLLDALLMVSPGPLHRRRASRKSFPLATCRREESRTTKGSEHQGCLPLPDGIAGFGTGRRAAASSSPRRPSIQRTSFPRSSWAPPLNWVFAPLGRLAGSVWPATPRDYSQACSPGLSRALRMSILSPIPSSGLDDMHVTQFAVLTVWWPNSLPHQV